MRERILLLISVVIIIIGLPSLLITSIIFEAELNNPENLILQSDPTTSLTGNVIKLSRNENPTVFTLSYKATIPVVFFDSTNIKQGDQIRIIGKVGEYNGKPQLFADKIS